MAKSGESLPIHIGAAKKEILAATSLVRLKVLWNKGEAMRQLGKAANDPHLINVATEFKLRCDRRMGELLNAMKENGEVKRGRRWDNYSDLGIINIKDLGITAKTSMRAQQVAKVPEDIFEAVIAEAKEEEKEITRKAIGKLINAAQREPPEKRSNLDPVPTLEIGDAVAWLKKQQPCDLLLTDPPYSTEIEDIEEFAQGWLPLALEKVKPTGRAYVFIGAYPREIKAYLNVALPEQVLVWTYRNTLGATPTETYKQNWQAVLYYKMPKAGELNGDVTAEKWAVQDVSAPDGRQGDRYYTWQKPDEIADRFIKHATNKGDTVLDPFAGSGTFLLAAGSLGRVGRGCERNRDAVNIAVERGMLCPIGDKT
jgi:16S rRNA G966 N2-methylase RsmD